MTSSKKKHDDFLDAWDTGCLVGTTEPYPVHPLAKIPANLATTWWIVFVVNHKLTACLYLKDSGAICAKEIKVTELSQYVNDLEGAKQMVSHCQQKGLLPEDLGSPTPTFEDGVRAALKVLETSAVQHIKTANDFRASGYTKQAVDLYRQADTYRLAADEIRVLLTKEM